MQNFATFEWLLWQQWNFDVTYVTAISH